MSDLIDILTTEAGVDGNTTSELLEKLGQDDTAFYRTALLRKLKVEVRAGRVVVGDSWRMRIDGRKMKVPVYRLA
jgi:hypothetical protein